ncbi:MAG: sugar phosphate isomerase/epimerase [Bdellovibrionaceae bacterium]|nr:sugar phosphate isomerase/epimerase [Bdellovibrio sp.]
MNWAVSNIAWPNELNQSALGLLKKFEINQIEIAPSKIWPDPFAVSPNEAQEFKRSMNQLGFDIVALQSLLYGRPELKIFESAASRQETSNYLLKMIDLAEQLGAKVVVFGSPKNRQRGALSLTDAVNMAIPFFKSIGDYACAREIHFCFEANATHYGCDFINTTDEANDLVTAVNSPGFNLHLDLGNMILSAEDPLLQINKYAKIAKHFHLSAPALKPIHELINLDRIVPLLQTFNHTVSLEMLSGKDDLADLTTSLQSIKNSIR